jgi:hypothetical protein
MPPLCVKRSRGAESRDDSRCEAQQGRRDSNPQPTVWRPSFFGLTTRFLTDARECAREFDEARTSRSSSNRKTHETAVPWLPLTTSAKRPTQRPPEAATHYPAFVGRFLSAYRIIRRA